MTSLKKKLMAAISMLTVSGMMLTTASFAWFTISTNPEISGLTTTVTVNENLEIAVAKESETTDKVISTDADAQYTTTSLSGNYYTYGNLVDFTYVAGQAAGDLGYDYADFLNGAATVGATDANLEDNVVLSPLSLDAETSGFKYPVYGIDGRMTSLATATVEKSDGTFGTLTDASDNIYGYYVDYWVRSNVAGDLTLTTASDRADGSTGTTTASTAVGSGSYFASTNEVLANNISIAFEVIETVESEGTNGYAVQTYTMAEADGIVDIDTVVVMDTTTATTATADDFGYIDESTTVWLTALSCPTASDTTTPITTLVANTDTLVRMYVYLDGATVTNASASTDVATITGSLNVQFALSSSTETVNNAMNTTLPAATTSSDDD